MIWKNIGKSYQTSTDQGTFVVFENEDKTFDLCFCGVFFCKNGSIYEAFKKAEEIYNKEKSGVRVGKFSKKEELSKYIYKKIEHDIFGFQFIENLGDKIRVKSGEKIFIIRIEEDAI